MTSNRGYTIDQTGGLTTVYFGEQPVWKQLTFGFRETMDYQSALEYVLRHFPNLPEIAQESLASDISNFDK